MKKRKVNDISVGSREEVGFRFDLKEESEVACLTEKGKEFQMTGPMYWKDLSPRVLLHTL